MEYSQNCPSQGAPASTAAPHEGSVVEGRKAPDLFLRDGGEVDEV